MLPQLTAPLTFTLPFPPVPRGCGWWGHSGRIDHASGPEKQHGRRVSQGWQPGERPSRRDGAGHSVGIGSDAAEGSRAALGDRREEASVSLRTGHQL